MSVIAEIAQKRQELLDALKANEGEINLHIFEDFYPDEAHFIYELLQNAEDAGATEVYFELLPKLCSFEHNGIRHFDRNDIGAITGIFNSSKKDSPDKIGRFGVGFKSVFVYTDTPVIYSKNYSFRIREMILPEEVEPKTELGNHTRFEFPFDSDKKDVTSAFREIESGLSALSATSLLFLNNIKYIRWSVGQSEGAILRETHSENHIEVLKLVDSEEVRSTHWLRFTESVKDSGDFSYPVEGLERQKIAVAYELQLLDKEKSFDKERPLSKQMKIVPAELGTVSVFFPAEKETSALRFHLHAPFVPELSRASIKQSSDNIPLLKQLANLAAKSLHSIRDEGLLSADFLAVLPNNDDNLPERYQIFRSTIVEEMFHSPLVPKYGGGYAPASRLVQARAPLKILLSHDDLAFLLGRDDEPQWAIGANQRNSNQDRMLGSLRIPTFTLEELKEFFETYGYESSDSWGWEDDDNDEDSENPFNEWLKTKPIEWFQGLYALLYRYCAEEEDFGCLDEVAFVPLTSGEFGTGASAYFLNGPALKDDPYLRVDGRLFELGDSKKIKEEARLFLENIGVREPNEVDEMRLLLASRYGDEADSSDDEQYISDLQEMMDFLERNPRFSSIFQNLSLFRVDSSEYGWATPNDIYLEEPYGSSGLSVLYGPLSDTSSNKKWPLSEWYLTCGISSDSIGKFAAAVGCHVEFRKVYERAYCFDNPEWNYLKQAPGQRSRDPINRDFALSSESLSLMEMKTVEASRLLWNALCRQGVIDAQVLRACYQLTRSGGPRYAHSQLVFSLRDIPWVPQKDGSFVTPKKAVVSQLPEGFVYDDAYTWLTLVEFGADERKRSVEYKERAARRAELGFESDEEVEEAQRFLSLPVGIRRRLLDEGFNSQESVELPERSVRNPELRRQRVKEEADNSQEKTSVMRERSVQVGVQEVKAESRVYLSGQYTNRDGITICQACRSVLPFKLPNGSFYFEAVELFSDARKRYREAYLALCPNHAAAFAYANPHKDEMYDLIATAVGNEIELELGGQRITVYFTEMHMADIQACVSSEEEME